MSKMKGFYRFICFVVIASFAILFFINAYAETKSGFFADASEYMYLYNQTLGTSGSYRDSEKEWIYGKGTWDRLVTREHTKGSKQWRWMQPFL